MKASAILLAILVIALLPSCSCRYSRPSPAAVRAYNEKILYGERAVMPRATFVVLDEPPGFIDASTRDEHKQIGALLTFRGNNPAN